MTTSFFRIFCKRIPLESIEYRNYRKLDQQYFLHNLDQKLIQGTFYRYKVNEIYLLTYLGKFHIGISL